MRASDQILTWSLFSYHMHLSAPDFSPAGECQWQGLHFKTGWKKNHGRMVFFFPSMLYHWRVTAYLSEFSSINLDSFGA